MNDATYRSDKGVASYSGGKLVGIYAMLHCPSRVCDKRQGGGFVSL